MSIPAGNETFKVRSVNHCYLFTDGSVAEVELAAGKTYVIGSISADFTFAWSKNDSLHLSLGPKISFTDISNVVVLGGLGYGPTC